MKDTNPATYADLIANLPLSSYPLNSFDREVLAAIANEPFESLFDLHGYPRNDVAARITVALGRDESDQIETYQSLKILKMLLTDARRKKGVIK